MINLTIVYLYNKGEKLTNLVFKANLGTKLLIFENFWISLSLTQISKYVNEIYTKEIDRT